MFLDKTLKRNTELMKTAFNLHSKGVIEPDTYILDYDAIVENAKYLKEEADKNNVKLYFMTKQLGRNPIICRALMDLGFEGAVAVDFKEAKILIKNGIKIGHVGHLVQIPSKDMEYIMRAKPESISVYSIEKAKEISHMAVKLGMKQNITLRIINEGDTLYPAQYGGFYLAELEDAAKELMKLPNINIYGITSFPCFLYDSECGDIKETNNIKTVHAAKEILQKLGIDIAQVNLPSATCTESIKKIKENGGTHGEPGHGLTGTTPYHAYHEAVEKPAIVYVSEISHNLRNKSFCYGGGHYRRSNIEKALVGKNIEEAKFVDVVEPTLESIDYYFTLKDNAEVGDTVIMAFRTQIFVTRSTVAVVKGISEGKPEVIGLYDSQGRAIE